MFKSDKWTKIGFPIKIKNYSEVEMFRIQPPEKIPRKAENKIVKRSVKIERNWRPGPQPTKPDNEVIF